MSYFSGKRVLITGAGSGIGALLAERLAQQGAEVIVTARRQAAADAVASRFDAYGTAKACDGCWEVA